MSLLLLAAYATLLALALAAYFRWETRHLRDIAPRIETAATSVVGAAETTRKAANAVANWKG